LGDPEDCAFSIQGSGRRATSPHRPDPLHPHPLCLFLQLLKGKTAAKPAAKPAPAKKAAAPATVKKAAPTKKAGSGTQRSGGAGYRQYDGEP
jgi:hypothetical protein